jgi:hypothetical protein
MKIITNNHYRPVLYWHELTTEEQEELKDSYDTIEESSFFRFKDWCYDLNDFLRVNDSLNGKGTDHELYGWDGYKNESFFSSVLVKLDDSGDSVKVGLALS